MQSPFGFLVVPVIDCRMGSRSAARAACRPSSSARDCASIQTGSRDVLFGNLAGGAVGIVLSALVAVGILA
jgi:hypothetical protein